LTNIQNHVRIRPSNKEAGMESVARKTKSGKKVFIPKVDRDELEELIDDANAGFCLACGSDTVGVEPDARQYECEVCGERKVYGIEELTLMGAVLIS
jgi:hypothetical protein